MEVSALDAPLDVARVKKDFPVLERLVHGKRLVYLDSASSSQKPISVIEGMSRYYETTHANVHRGVYEIAQEATRLYEEARAKVARFIGASSADEVVFTKNATEAINLVAYAWGRKNLGASDVVVTSEIEHHANFVPWLQLRSETGTELRFLRLGEDGMLVLDDLPELLEGAKLLAVTAASNVLGTLPPVHALADAAHAAGALVLLDAAQYVPHMPTSVTDLGADFVAFTGHKMLGPTGIGALWARRELLEQMPPFLTGGEMIPRRASRRLYDQRRAVEVRSGDAPDRRSNRPRHRYRLPAGARDGRGPGTRRGIDRLRHESVGRPLR